MQPSVLISGVISSVAARLHAGTQTSSPIGDSAPNDVESWMVAIASVLVLVAVGGVATRVADRLTRTSTPELIVLLNQSAAFYARWPEDRHGAAPSVELMTEATRCRRIIELLERRAIADGAPAPAERGPIDSLRTWVAVLHKQIGVRGDADVLNALA